MAALETILIVDDEPMVREMFSDFLRECQYRVLSAESGKEALALLKDDVVDLLLTDIIMPETDGYELAAKVSQLHPNVQIQLMSGFSETGNQHLVSPRLFQQLLQKPINLDELLHRVKELLS